MDAQPGTSKQMLKFFIVFSCVSIFAIVQPPAAWGQILSCEDVEGIVYPIPEGKKPVLVPAWLDPERLIVIDHMAQGLEPKPRTIKCDSGELAVSPAVCEDQ